MKNKILLTLCQEQDYSKSFNPNVNKSWIHYDNWVDSVFVHFIPLPGSTIVTKKGTYFIKNTPYVYDYRQIQEENEEDNGGECVFINVDKKLDIFIKKA